MKRLFLSLILILLIPTIAFSAGSVVSSYEDAGAIRFVTFYWTSDASGDVSDEGSIAIPGGSVYQMIADPTDATDLYDVTVSATWNTKTGTGTRRETKLVDILSGVGANLSSSTDGETKDLPKAQGLPSCRLELTVANAGNATSGVIVLLLWRE